MKNLICIVTFQIGVDVLGFIKNWHHEHWAIDVQSKYMKSNTSVCNKGFIYQCSQYPSTTI